ncbi:hypothetical protein B7494_g4530 [Chlorociboria aeruginascens]|nr:hypothetical protein B7494_g4530 [Chlorociboria aeruginascens]
MPTNDIGDGTPTPEHQRSFSARSSAPTAAENSDGTAENVKGRPTKWSMGVLNDRTTHEVPGSVLLLTGKRNEPLGLRNAPARTSASTLPPQSPTPSDRPALGSRRSSRLSRRKDKASDEKKKTKDGAIILDPQPEDSHNDPLNWPAWRRDSALLSLGLYCMLGGGMTPILAAGFTNVASTYHVTTPKVALTTGLYMMGLGVGSVFASPTAILYGKRPVYLAGAIVFIVTSVWCATSPSYNSLLIARIFQGISVSPVECLPSATIAEIFFLHERAYRIGIYTLLLLGGKNLIPLVSAAIIQSLGWRWVFWMVAIVAGFCWVLLFLFVPETFWDRTPRPKNRDPSRRTSRIKSVVSYFRLKTVSQNPHKSDLEKHVNGRVDDSDTQKSSTTQVNFPRKPSLAHGGTHNRSLHVGFASNDHKEIDNTITTPAEVDTASQKTIVQSEKTSPVSADAMSPKTTQRPESTNALAPHEIKDQIVPQGGVPPTPALFTFNSPSYDNMGHTNSEYLGRGLFNVNTNDGTEGPERSDTPQHYTALLRDSPRLTFIQQLKPFNGRLHQDNWFRVAVRPFILFAYPAVLWSAIVYSCSIGWLIVLSESVATIFRTKDTYNFSALSAGLIYLSPFIGGVMGTAVAGKVSDFVVRAMAKRNGGLYEPEFRLIMAIPVAVTTVIGLMGFGWSAQIHDAWIVPTIFFGIISFGCSLGSTTAITFCVDSYRVYAGEALVTLNFSKNIFHGLVFSLFFNTWLEADGSRMVFIWLGIIQLILMTLTIPMYIFGKRARMWTSRKNLMEKF